MEYKGYTITARIYVHDFKPEDVEHHGGVADLKNVKAGEYDIDSYVLEDPDGRYVDTLEPQSLEEIKKIIDEDIAKEVHIEQ